MHRRRAARGQGTGQMVGFLLATVVLLAAFGVISIVVVENQPDDAKAAARQTELSSSATRVATLTTGSAGVGWYEDGSCDQGILSEDGLRPDSVQRFGLAVEPCGADARSASGSLAFEKLLNLQRSAFDADATNGHVDYEEARASLGLDRAGLDFHVRTAPALASVREALAEGYRDPFLRPLYIGDYEDSEWTWQLDHESGFFDDGSSGVFWVNLTNDGVSTTAFEVEFSIDLLLGTVQGVRHVPLVPPGGDANVSVAFPKTLDWMWSVPTIDYVVRDPGDVVAEGSVDTSQVDMTWQLLVNVFDASVDEMAYVLDGDDVSARVDYEAYDGLGQVVSYAGWSIWVFGPQGGLAAFDGNLHGRGWESFTLSELGSYDVYLTDSFGAIVAQDTLLVVDAPIDPYDPFGAGDGPAPMQSTALEAAYLAALVQSFRPFVFNQTYDHPLLPYMDGGDVLPDVKEVMNTQLRAVLFDDKGTPSASDDEPTLDEYNVLFVGSNVAHESMTSSAAKATIRDWVLAGGMLVALGSDDQSVQWLQPLFHVSIETGSGGLSAPDPSHPVLSVPNPLDWQAFDAHGVSWDIKKAEDQERFSYVLVDGDTALLAVSDHGAFGDGRIILSAFQPWDLLAGPQEPACDPASLAAECQGLALVHNVLTQAYDGLFVDYGPEIPANRAAATSGRLAYVDHPFFGPGVAMHVRVYVF